METSNKRIAILVEDLYEDLEFWYPYYRMKEAGAKIDIIGTGKEIYTGKNGLKARPDMQINEVTTKMFDAVIIPGGYAPDKLRRSRNVLDFIKNMDEKNKIIAFICHAGWVLVSARILLDREVTSYYAIRDDLMNAGAIWIDAEVVRDGNMISSRNPDDLPVFCKAIVDALSEVRV